mgnify:CR=1 FL=1
MDIRKLIPYMRRIVYECYFFAKKDYFKSRHVCNLKIYVRLTYYVYYSIIGNSHNNFCMNVTTFKTKKGRFL